MYFIDESEKVVPDIKIIKKSKRQNPKISLVLLDWSVRESFHLFHYLSSQTMPRDAFEVIVIEYYDRISEPIREFEEQVDSWVVLNMPKHCYYHKHLMYNVGIALSCGDIVMIGDSDAMVKESFIETIINAFEADPNIVFHMDQFRNTRRDLYPFCYPSFEEVLGEGCINNEGGKTAGVLNITDPLHSRNYGACMCARRDDMIKIGGADEHIDYLGHICGPYDLTFRLINIGKKEIWHQQEFLYHTWHPGQAGADNYMGPHDGKHMSTTAMEAITSKRVQPLLENPVIKEIREGKSLSLEEKLASLIRPEFLELWDTERLDEMASHNKWTDHSLQIGQYNGLRISVEIDRFIARPIEGIDLQDRMKGPSKEYLESSDINDLFSQIDNLHPPELIRVIVEASKRDKTQFFYQWAKGFVRNILAHGYRAIKFHDTMSTSAFVKVFANIPRKIFHCQRDIRDAINWTRGAHGSLVSAIYYQRSKERNNEHEEGIPLILVHKNISFDFLNTVKKEKIIPDFELEFVKDMVMLKNVLRRIMAEKERRSIIVSSDAYTQFQSVFIETGAPQNMFIV